MVYITKFAPIVPEVEVSNATERRYVSTPQRKANPKDKNRPKRRDLKEIVFLKTGCNSTPEIKKYLIMLGYCLDLRLTSAWKAVRDELVDEIKAIKAASSVLSPAPSHPTEPEYPFKPGDPVIWHYPHPSQCYIEQWFPLFVTKVKDNFVLTDMVQNWIPFDQLELA